MHGVNQSGNWRQRGRISLKLVIVPGATVKTVGVFQIRAGCSCERITIVGNAG